MDNIQRIRLNMKSINSISQFISYKGAFSSGCKDVCMVRVLGISPDLPTQIEEADKALSADREIFYNRISVLPNPAPTQDISYYQASYDSWVSNGKRDMNIRLTAANPQLSVLLGKACCDGDRFFRNCKKGSSESMVKNFIVKSLFRIDTVLEGLCISNISGIKIIAVNCDKLQDYLLCYMLTQLGADVLIIQCERDIDTALGNLNLSRKALLGEFGKCNISQYDKGKYSVAAPQNRPVPSVTSNAPTPSTNQAVRTNPVTHSGGFIPMQGESSQVPANNSSLPLSGGRIPSNNNGNSRGGHTSFSNVQTSRPVNISHPSRSRTNTPQPAVAVNTQVTRNSAVNISRPANSARPAQRREKSPEELARLASSVVMIAIHNQRGEIIGTGSGIMIGRGGFILTNNHVASGGKFYSVRIEDDEQTYQTNEVIKYNPVLDLAVIRIQRELQPLEIFKGNEKLVRGQKVIAIGSPMGLFNSVSDGIIAGFRNVDNVNMIQFTAPTSHGSSGGAVLNLFGEVIGISTAGIDNAQNINLAVGYESILPFVRGLM